MKTLFLFLFTCTMVQAGDLRSMTRGVVEDLSKLKYKVAMATRTKNSPVIDGIINDKVWEQAVLIEEFFQHEPYNLELPSVETEVRILCDDN